jgi:pyruvate formate lyase activating enzyme
MKKIKKLGFLIKLDTNGSHPEVLEKIIDQELADYIAMDIKHAPGKLEQLVKYNAEQSMKASIALIMKSTAQYEFRSTILPHCHSNEDIAAMGSLIFGAKRWYLQSFRPLKTLDKKFEQYRSFTADELQILKKTAMRYAVSVDVRM